MNLSANGAHPPQPEPYAWCLACRRSRPCVRNQGTTDWQTTPIYTCRSCGQVTHETVTGIVAVPPPPYGTGRRALIPVMPPALSLVVP